MRAYLVARKRLLAAVIVISTLVGVCAVYLNGGADASSLQIAAATTHVLVDRQDQALVGRRYTADDYEAAAWRAELLSQVMASKPVLTRIAREMGLPDGSVGGFARTTAAVPHALTEPDLEERAAQIAESKLHYRIEVQARPSDPVIDIYSQAPSTDAAERLGTAAIDGLRGYLRDLAAQPGVAKSESIRLEALGDPHGDVINSHVPPAIDFMTFMVAFGLTGSGLLALIAWHRRRQAPPTAESPGEVWTDNWPHTSRLLPWMLAGFIALLWLVPFDQIQLSFSTPIDLKLDRLVLPFVFAIWIVAFAAGGRMAPRLRLNPITLAVAAFVACAFLSVVVDARWLNQTLEIDQSLKRLPLLVSYVSLFFIAASTVRPAEVRAFLTLTLWLAVICALGIIWEYRWKYNVFYGLSRQLLPGFFTVTTSLDATEVDGIGRRLVRGPAALPLEAVAMLSMALPIALVWLMQAKTYAKKAMYGAIACLLLAAMVATFRKSALLIPVPVFAALIFYRPRQMVRFAPLALVLVGMIHVLAPGALGSTTSQFSSSRLGVATVSDRAVDYDAIRPELWTHLLLGKGWGSYDRYNYRVLDTEILQRLIEMGVIGLILYLLMPLAVVICARKTIAARGEMAPLALIGTAAALSFVVASTLFDVLSFPHTTYIFLYMSGLVAVVVGAKPAPAPPPRPRIRARRAVRSPSHEARRELVSTQAR